MASPPTRSPAVVRLRRRAALLAVVAVVVSVGVAIYNAGQAGRMFLMVRSLTPVPLTAIEIDGPCGHLHIDRLALGQSEGAALSPSPDGIYRFHVKYQAEGAKVPESDLRILTGKGSLEAIELQITAEGIAPILKNQEAGLAERLGRAFSRLRGR